MRVLMVLLLVGCAREQAAPVANTLPPADDPLVRLAGFRDRMCACVQREADPGVTGVDEECPDAVASDLKKWAAAVKWPHAATEHQRTEGERIIDETQRCFQAAIGDPLPPRSRRAGS